MSLRFFIDASAIFAMAYSERGASRELFHLAKQSTVTLITSVYALSETERRIEQTYPETNPKFKEIKSSEVFEIQEATELETADALNHVADPFDAPIIAAAKKSKANALVSFDRKHLHKQSVSDYIGMSVIFAGDALKLIREEK